MNFFSLELKFAMIDYKRTLNSLSFSYLKVKSEKQTVTQSMANTLFFFHNENRDLNSYKDIINF